MSIFLIRFAAYVLSHYQIVLKGMGEPKYRVREFSKLQVPGIEPTPSCWLLINRLMKRIDKNSSTLQIILTKKVTFTNLKLQN